MKKIYFLTLALICTIVANAADVTIHVRKSGPVSDVVALWAWDANGNNYTGGAWPGTVFTETEVAADGNTYWKQTISVSADTYSIIFNNNGGGGQTADITGLSASETDVWYVVYDSWTYSKISEPTAGGTVEPTGLTYNVTVPEGTCACYIAGDMTGWSHTEMTKVDDTHYTITIEGATEAHGYKYCSGPDWAYVEKNDDGSEMSQNRTYSENDVVARWASVYNPGVVEEEGLTYTVTVPEGTETCYICGAWDWSAFLPMEKVVGETNKFTVYIATAKKSHEYKYTKTASWDYVETQADGINDVANRTYNENDVVITWKGEALEIPTVEGGKRLFLKPNSWTSDGARFAAYFWDADGNSKWVDFTLDDNVEIIYGVVVPEGIWTGFKFIRMNPSTTENRWNSDEENAAEAGSDLAGNKPVWNSGYDLSYDGEHNLYVINDDTAEDWEDGYWTSIDENVVSVEETLVDSNAAVEYFNLQGVKVDNPENGIFIKKQGAKATKVVL